MADARPDDLDRLVSEAANPGPCPDENALAALGEGRLAAGERDAVLAHVAACPACSWVTGGLLEAAPAPVAQPRRAPLLRILPWAAAAAVLVAAGAWWFTRNPSPEPLAHTDSEHFLADASAQLAREVPDRFRDFTPLSRAELAAEHGDPLRGADAVVLPAGRLLDPRPSFSWPPVPGAKTYAVALIGSAGELWRWTSLGSPSLKWPGGEKPLAPGASYVWTMTADDPHGTRTERTISLASPEETAAWLAAVADVKARVSPEFVELVLAHLALRRGFLTEALRAATAHALDHPDDAFGAETVKHANARLGAR